VVSYSSPAPVSGTGADYREAWVKWAIDAIADSLEAYEKYESYYIGDHELEFATDRWIEAFGDTFEEFSDNWCQIVVDSVVQRLEITGWTTDNGENADTKLAEEIWDENELHIEEGDLYTGTLVKGDGYLMVWPDPDEDPLEDEGNVCEVYYNDALFTQVYYDPEHRRKIARGTKRFLDLEGNVHLNIYTPEWIYKFQNTVGHDPQRLALMEMNGETLDILPSGWAQVEKIKNPYDIVPIFHFRNRTGVGTHGLSELKSVIPVQNAVNKMLMDLMVGSEFGSFRQKWIAGGGVPKNADGTTGWRAGGSRVWHTTDPDAKFGEFGQIDLEPIYRSIEALVTHLAKISQTPMHYLRVSGDMPSGEALKTAESGLVEKVQDRQKNWGSPWSKAMGFAIRIRKGSYPETPVFPVFRDAETRHDLEQAQTAQLKAILGIPLEQLWMEHFDYTSDQVKEFKNSNRALASAVLAQVVAQVGQLPPGSEKVTADPQALIELVKASPAVAPNADGETGLNVTQILSLLGKGITSQTAAGEATTSPQANTRPPASPTRRGTGFKD